jgi:23S rRNA pseudouridine2604 synthase
VTPDPPTSPTDPPTERLAKVMARRGMCSKRTADRLIEAGQVLVDGRLAPPRGLRVPLDARIELLDDARAELDALRTIALHKPAGIVSNLPQPGQREAIDILRPEGLLGYDRPDRDREWAAVRDHLESFHVAGRLDYDSSGLLVLTQDGVLARMLTGDDHPIEKEYLVRISLRGGKPNQPFPPHLLDRLRTPIHHEGETLRAVAVDAVEPRLLRFVLREGRKRHIRRMCDAVDLRVRELVRIRIGALHLGDLQPRQWRFVTRADIAPDVDRASGPPRR